MKNVISKLTSKWYYFLVSLIIISVSFSLLINTISTPKRNESVTLFIASNGVGESFERKINEDLPDYLMKVFINAKNENDQYVGQSFATSGIQLSDAFILPNNFLDASEYSSLCYDLDTSYINEYCNYNFEYIYYDNKAYGIKMYDKNSRNGLAKKYISYSTNHDYYMFFNKSSLQLGKLNDTNDGIFYILQKIIGLA